MSLTVHQRQHNKKMHAEASSVRNCAWPSQQQVVHCGLILLHVVLAPGRRSAKALVGLMLYTTTCRLWTLQHSSKARVACHLQPLLLYKCRTGFARWVRMSTTRQVCGPPHWVAADVGSCDCTALPVKCRLKAYVICAGWLHQRHGPRLRHHPGVHTADRSHGAHEVTELWREC
jgi:hypothetical protein